MNMPALKFGLILVVLLPTRLWADPLYYQTQTLAKDQDCPRAMAMDTGYIYWVNRGDHTLVKAAKLDGQPVVLAKNVHVGPHPRAVAVDFDRVYWGNVTDNSIRAIKLDGSSPKVVARSPEPPIALAVDQDHVYWSTATAIMKVSKHSGQRRILADGGSLGSIAVDCCFVYFADREKGTISKVSNLGGRIYRLAGSRGDFQDGRDLVVQPGNASVYWLGDKTPGVCKTSNTFGGAVNRLTHNATGSHAGLTLVKGTLYYHDTYRIWRVSPHDGRRPQLVTTSSEPINALLADDSHLYWTASRESGNEPVGRVMKIDRLASERHLTASP